jgi:autotransporter-associated beta strand protein
MKGDSENVQTVTFNSGILKNSAPTSTSGLPGARVALGGPNCVFEVTTANSSLTISNAEGSGGLVKTGLGLLTLTTNGYAGNTTVSNGTLVLNFPTLAANSTVTVSTNAALGTNALLTLNFANSETNTVSALILGGVSKPNGVYNATTDPLYLSGAGSLQVTPSINPLPGPIQFGVSGSTLALSWPTNLGWILQSETNLSSNAWFDVANSGNVTSTNITINPATSSLFFRLRHP